MLARPTSKPSAEDFAERALPEGQAEIGSEYIRGCLQGAIERGFDPAELLRAAQIDASVYSDPDARIGGEQLQRLLMTIRRALNDEYMGFLETQGKLQMSYMVSRAAVRCKTFGQALQKIVKLVNAVRADVDLSLAFDADRGEVAITFKVSGFRKAVEPHFLSWFTLFGHYKFLCWLIGERIKLSKVGFSAAMPENVMDYSRFFGCPVEFGQERAILSFSDRYLNAPVIRNEVELREPDFDYGLSNWFSIPGKDQSFATQIEQLLLDLYREGSCPANLDVLGDIVCCSPRTLSRRLQRENVTFQEIKVKVRRELAQKLLASTNLSITDIAEKVGFAEPADFTRAYVSWTGRTPSDYRAQRRRS